MTKFVCPACGNTGKDEHGAYCMCIHGLDRQRHEEHQKFMRRYRKHDPNAPIAYKVYVANTHIGTVRELISIRIGEDSNDVRLYGQTGRWKRV